VLEAHLPEAELAEVRRLLYGKVPASLPISDDARKLAEERSYDIKYVSPAWLAGWLTTPACL
jgi:hypothetical protein